MVVGKLMYNGENGGYSIVNSDIQIDLHCGDVFEYQSKYGEWIETRIEKNEYGWYLVEADITSIEFECREYDKKVRIDR